MLPESPSRRKMEKSREADEPGLAGRRFLRDLLPALLSDASEQHDTRVDLW